MGRKKFTTAEFIKRGKLKHGDKYCYSDSIYIGNKTKLIIKCNHCKCVFFQSPNKHLSHGCGCPLCARLKNGQSQKSNINDFIVKAIEIHGDLYDYSDSIYINAHTKLLIKCIKCDNIFSQKPHDHINGGNGCPKCKSSKGEKAIRKFLIDNNLFYEEQKKFKDCMNKGLLSFDFYIPSKNLLIEFQGIQHYQPVHRFGGFKAYTKQLLHDSIKRSYCIFNNILLLEIRYDQIKEVDNILEKVLNI